MVHIDGDELTFSAYTATGQIYDKFQLKKQGNRKANLFVEMNDQAIAERTHGNTITYEDFIPESYLDAIRKKYADYEIDGIDYLFSDDFEGCEVELEGDKYEITLTLDAKGNIVKEEKELD